MPGRGRVDVGARLRAAVPALAGQGHEGAVVEAVDGILREELRLERQAFRQRVPELVRELRRFTSDRAAWWLRNADPMLSSPSSMRRRRR